MAEALHPRVIDALAVRTGDVHDLTGRVVTQTRSDGDTVTLHFGPHMRIELPSWSRVRIRRNVREVSVDTETADHGHVWFVEGRRPY